MQSENEQGLGPLPNSIVVFVLIIVVSIGSIYLYSEVINGTSEDGRKKFTSENYGFSFTYPSNWIVENRKNPYTGSLMVMARENATENVSDPKAGFQINAGSLGITSVENFKNNLLSQVENNENVSIVEGPTDVTRGGFNGFNLTLSVEMEQGQFESRYLLLMEENTQYWINSYLQENSEVDFEVKNVVSGLGATEVTSLNVLPHESTIPPEEQEERGREAIGIIEEALGEIDVETNKKLRFSEDIAEGILKTSDEMDSNLIILGVGDKPGWLRFIRGDVVEKVVHESKCPVLVLPKSPDRQMFVS